MEDENVCRSFTPLLRAGGIQPATHPSAEALLEDAKRPGFTALVYAENPEW